MKKTKNPRSKAVEQIVSWLWGGAKLSGGLDSSALLHRNQKQLQKKITNKIMDC